ncbi:MAG: UDP-N-acetylglucosamine--LPS N-acetylglucosamine transferase [Candidatus Melainabacteria bacterium]|nr:UDP-N-acetylglucosamine--LPS N-acetylglucosamine transferase [Candidatus Melainabacteria bacterium]
MMKRVLILSASSGAGHIRAGQALLRAFESRYPEASVEHVDALSLTNFAFRNFYSKAYIEMVNSLPGVLGLLYDFADEPWKDENRRLIIDRFNMRPLIRQIIESQPDLIVCTHFLPAEIVSHLICRRRIKSRLAVVITDLDVHSMWLCHHYHRYFVAMEETRIHLSMLGFEPSRIEVSGIPVDPVFRERKEKSAMRARYGLDPDLPTIYLSTGGFGVGRSREILESLAPVRNRVQVLAMCGRNQRLYDELSGTGNSGKCTMGNVTVVPVGFTTDVDEYMAASDMVLGKPGGLTTSEALARGLAFVIVNPIPGQEERNADHLLEQGVAIRCNNLPALAYKVDALLDQPEKLVAMQGRALQMARPGAAGAIVESLMTGSETEPGNTAERDHRCRPLRSGSIKQWTRGSGLRFQIAGSRDCQPTSLAV